MCDCWENPPTLYECRIVTARKQHKCSECLRIISVGEQYEYVKGLWDGCFSKFCTCNDCTSMRDEIGLKCYAHGLMMDELDQRDYPGVASVSNFLERRRENYFRNRSEEVI